jgi:imidazole glycerol-phosphate synthase subunit HisH
VSDRAPIVVVDVGLGNLRSVERALHAALVAEGLDPGMVQCSNDPGALREASALVMPGQGAFGDCATALHRHGGALAKAVGAHLADDRPYLGICLGLQVLFESSEEAGGAHGLGVFRGAVRRFRDGVTDARGERLKVPHMGWNQVLPAGDAAAAWLGRSHWYYFVHSYFVAPEPASAGCVAGETEHGGRFVSAVARGRLWAVQFHPEKSQAAGLSLLRSFVRSAA